MLSKSSSPGVRAFKTGKMMLHLRFLITALVCIVVSNTANAQFRIRISPPRIDIPIPRIDIPTVLPNIPLPDIPILPNIPAPTLPMPTLPIPAPTLPMPNIPVPPLPKPNIPSPIPDISELPETPGMPTIPMAAPAAPVVMTVISSGPAAPYVLVGAVVLVVGYEIYIANQDAIDEFFSPEKKDDKEHIVQSTGEISPKSPRPHLKHPASELPTSGDRPYQPEAQKGNPEIVKAGKGFWDRYGNRWDWAEDQHGGPHWDVQHHVNGKPTGKGKSHTNVDSKGKVIGKDNFPNKKGK